MKKALLILTTLISGSVHADFFTVGNRLYTIDPQTGKSSRVDLDEEAERSGIHAPVVKSSNMVSVNNRLYVVDPRTGRSIRVDLDEKQELRRKSRPVVYP